VNGWLPERTEPGPGRLRRRLPGRPGGAAGLRGGRPAAGLRGAAPLLTAVRDVGIDQGRVAEGAGRLAVVVEVIGRRVESVVPGRRGDLVPVGVPRGFLQATYLACHLDRLAAVDGGARGSPGGSAVAPGCRAKACSLGVGGHHAARSGGLRVAGGTRALAAARAVGLGALGGWLGLPNLVQAGTTCGRGTAGW
jgi:hypothetical protein